MVEIYQNDLNDQFTYAAVKMARLEGDESLQTILPVPDGWSVEECSIHEIPFPANFDMESVVQPRCFQAFETPDSDMSVSFIVFNVGCADNNF